ncbi:uncharacterized protein EV422DRAFT_619880 [Fimicolochytrium jonesii]|uniref:uncharacterized protein n=1 Tax=Fimicolochytrium jonesii TaxID=1396493 RepID=UPI0022FEC5D5|nr:uncharacterized protein EV422DRAFT_619880 [Fimicolochytrium jonesii]KAI8820970.1 hypothetical protein EV422DRAFT_619880 [Fimicolochytrium jonesii]
MNYFTARTTNISLSQSSISNMTQSRHSVSDLIYQCEVRQFARYRPKPTTPRTFVLEKVMRFEKQRLGLIGKKSVSDIVEELHDYLGLAVAAEENRPADVPSSVPISLSPGSRSPPSASHKASTVPQIMAPAPGFCTLPISADLAFAIPQRDTLADYQKRRARIAAESQSARPPEMGTVSLGSRIPPSAPHKASTVPQTMAPAPGFCPLPISADLAFAIPQRDTLADYQERRARTAAESQSARPPTFNRDASICKISGTQDAGLETIRPAPSDDPAVLFPKHSSHHQKKSHSIKFGRVINKLKKALSFPRTDYSTQPLAHAVDRESSAESGPGYLTAWRFCVIPPTERRGTRADPGEGNCPPPSPLRIWLDFILNILIPSFLCRRTSLNGSHDFRPFLRSWRIFS